MGRDFYAIFGVSRCATQPEIDNAYNILLRRYYPQTNSDPSVGVIFGNIFMGYDILRDPIRRKIYDQYGEEGLYKTIQTEWLSTQAQSFTSNTSIDPTGVLRHISSTQQWVQNWFSTIRNFNIPNLMYDPQQPRNGLQICENIPRQFVKDPTVYIDLMLTLNEINTGCEKSVNFMRTVTDSNNLIHEEVRVFNITVKKGSKEGTTIIFNNEGNRHPGRIPADVVFIVKDLPHPHFIRDEHNNLIYKAKISLADALMGLTIQLPLLDGSIHSVPTKNIINPESEIIICCKGLPHPKNTQNNGDIIIRFIIIFPESINSPDFYSFVDSIRNL